MPCGGASACGRSGGASVGGGYDCADGGHPPGAPPPGPPG